MSKAQPDSAATGASSTGPDSQAAANAAAADPAQLARRWQEANRSYLAAALGRVRRRLEAAAEVAAGEEPRPRPAVPPAGAPASGRSETAGSDGPDGPDGPGHSAETAWPPELPPPAHRQLMRSFGLGELEGELLLLAAAVELEPAIAHLCATLNGDPHQPWPTAGLAMALYGEPAASDGRADGRADGQPAGDQLRASLAPSAPLRRWRLLQVGRGGPFASATLSIDERVLFYLCGLPADDDRLAGLIEQVTPAGELVTSHRRLAERLVAAWSRGLERGLAPVVELTGPDSDGKEEIAAAAAAAFGLYLYRLPAGLLPTNASELEGLIRLLTRESSLASFALLLDATGELTGAGEGGEAADRGSRQEKEAAIRRFVDLYGGPMLVAAGRRLSASRRLLLSFEAHRPTAAEQRHLWRRALGDQVAGLDGVLLAEQLEQLTAQFHLPASAIRSAAMQALGRAAAGGRSATGGDGTADDRPEERLAEQLWQACCAHARPRLEALAQLIRPAASPEQLVLPARESELLDQVLVHVRRRTRVYDNWGFADRGERGLGISALFAGPSGTGKTMAAEVLAGQLGLDLYRVDLASVVSKYIGETEKNLKQIFDAAEEGGAVLLFDEADALFGKRSEVKDSHDRYANIEVGYLLQRMEAYRGLAILTTNLKDSLDPAFLRRIRFVVRFPFPDAALREKIWRRAFPADTPTEGLDPARLARLGVAGGNIRNIALGAAFLAAEDGTPVRMQHLLAAARAECAKLEKPLTDREIGGWL